MKMTCNIVRDLVPSFVDEICSEDSRELINEHIQTCKSCRDYLESLRKPLLSINLTNENDKIKAQKPFKKLNMIYRIKIFIVALTAIVMTLIGAMIAVEVETVSNFIFPQQTAVINEENEMDSWRAILPDGNQYLNYNSIFYKKMITNNANSTGSIKMRILDEDGTIIMDDLVIEPGISIDLKKLENNRNYIVEIWVDTGWYMLCFN